MLLVPVGVDESFATSELIFDELSDEFRATFIPFSTAILLALELLQNGQ